MDYNCEGEALPCTMKWKYPWFREITKWDGLFVYTIGGLISHRILQNQLLEGYWNISLNDPRPGKC